MSNQENTKSTAAACPPESALLCGCGKPARYMTFKNGEIYEGSCNKYQRCLTRDELISTLATANARLNEYIKAVNEIDDYFEYAMESKKDQKQVHKILGNLTDRLAT